MSMMINVSTDPRWRRFTSDDQTSCCWFKTWL